MNAPFTELQELVGAYVSGKLDAEGVDRLTRILQESAEALDFFLLSMDLHAEMTVDKSLPPASSPAGESLAALPDHRCISQDGEHIMTFPGRSRPWRRAVLAACLVVIFLAMAFLVQRGKTPPLAPGESGGGVLEFVAVMTDATDAVWKTGGFVPRDVGDAIGPATVELVSGRAEFEFDSGARVAIGGPAVFEFLSPMRARLHTGQLTAFVPEAARGFTVEFEGAKLVDLGTEFAINSDGRNSAEVHVYDGEVVVHHDDAPKSRPLTLRANDTKKLETGEGKVADALFESERFLRIHRDIRTPETTGDIRYLNRPPRSVLHGAFEHNQYILLFRERADLNLPRQVQVNAAVPGEYRTRRKPEDPPGTAVAVRTESPQKISAAALPEGTRLTSYFVHFDPVRGGPHGVHRSGSIRFDRPILGVIIATRDMVPTDDILGSPGTLYETTDFAVTRNGLEPDDRITVGEDLHTVDLRLGAGTSVDHVRVLVAAE